MTVPVVAAYQRAWERVVAGLLSLWVLGALRRRRRARRRAPSSTTGRASSEPRGDGAARATAHVRCPRNARRDRSAPDLRALEAITEAVAAGAGLPEIVRAAARALDASLVLIDRTSVVLAVAARSPAEERALLREAEGVERVELRVADAVVGQLRLRGRDGGEPPTPRCCASSRR